MMEKRALEAKYMDAHSNMHKYHLNLVSLDREKDSLWIF